MKKLSTLLLIASAWTASLLLCAARDGFPADDAAGGAPWDNWANWQARLDDAFDRIPARKLPGHTMGIIAPNDTRNDLLPMTAFGYGLLSRDQLSTVVIFLPAPADMKLNGLAVPDFENLETNIGRFPIDTTLAARLLGSGQHVSVEDNYFTPSIPKLLEIQLAALKYEMKGKLVHIKVLPILVKLEDPNSQAKDLAPVIAEAVRTIGLDTSVTFVVLGNLSRATSEEKIIPADNIWLSSIRSLDADGMLGLRNSPMVSSADVKTPDLDTLVLGLLTMRCLGADHSEILAYAHTGQLILTKDRSSPLSYVAAGVASAPLISPKIPHVKREKMVDIFNDLLRADILAMTRQTCASILDPTAAKPPSLVNREAEKPWPVYVSLYDESGNVAGQAGTHVPVGPLEESIRRFSFDAVQKARPKLTKDTFSKYVVDVSIPYGFLNVTRPEELQPFLNGVIVHFAHKTSAWHPDVWRIYPDAHQILSAICGKLGIKPWAYATDVATVESFRVLGFNEKEPFQDLNADSRKRKKKDQNNGDSTGGDGGLGGGLPF